MPRKEYVAPITYVFLFCNLDINTAINRPSPIQVNGIGNIDPAVKLLSNT